MTRLSVLQPRPHGPVERRQHSPLLILQATMSALAAEDKGPRDFDLDQN